MCYTVRMKKFRYVFTNTIKFLIWAITVLGAVAIVFTLIRLLGLFDTASAHPSIDVAVVVAVAAVIGVIVYTFFASFYVIDKMTLTLRLGIFSQTVKGEELLSVYKLAKDDSLWIAYRYKNSFCRLRISVSAALTDDFVKALKEINPEVIFEIKPEDESADKK